MRYLVMAGCYRKICLNCSTIACSLITLLKKDVKFSWAESCQLSFDKNMALLINHLVLTALDSSKEFKLVVDANDVGVCAVLLQEN